MGQLKQSTTRNIAFLLVDSADHITGKTGLTVTVTLSKDAAAFGAAGGTVTEISSGWYKIALTTTDTNTLGDLVFHCTAAGADPSDFKEQVVTLLPGDGVTVTTNNDKTGYALSAGGVTAVQSGLATSAAQTTLQADTDDIQTRLPAALVSGRMDSSVGAMATDVLTSGALAASAVTEIAAGVAAGSAPTAADNAAAVWNAAAASFNTAGSMGQKMNAAGGAADPLTNSVPGSYVAGSAGYAIGNLPQGNGPIIWSYRVTRSDTGAGVAGVTIWVTSDAAGTARLAGPLVTDSSGYVTPLLPAGTAYFWRFADGFTGPNPDTEVVA